MTAEAPSETSLFARPLNRIVNLVSSSATPPQHSDSDLPVGETLELLAPTRRQAVLEILHASPQCPVPVSTLAEYVASEEYDCDVDEVTTEQRKRVYIALYQSHLPTLAQADVVTYDADESWVKVGPEFHRIWQVYTAVLESLSE